MLWRCDCCSCLCGVQAVFYCNNDGESEEAKQELANTYVLDHPNVVKILQWELVPYGFNDDGSAVNNTGCAMRCVHHNWHLHLYVQRCTLGAYPPSETCGETL